MSDRGGTPSAFDSDALAFGTQLINGLTSGLIAVNAQGGILAANAAAQTHLNVAGASLEPGCSIADLAPGPYFESALEEVLRTGRPVTREEISVECDGGPRREVGFSASPLGRPDSVEGVVFLFTDMTERRRLERAAELNRHLAAMGELTAGVVHELRSPLSVIGGMSELLLRKVPEGDSLRGAIEAISKEAAQMERLVARFLGFARPFAVAPKPCNAREVIDRAVQLVRRHADRQAARLEVDCPDSLPPLPADADKVGQALANLLDNALDASKPGGRVWVKGRASDSEVVFTVEDEGPGIDTESGDNLFSPFLTRKEGGTGLGLAIVHRIVTAHGGTAQYDNRPEGGARFEVRLPLER